MPNTPQPARPAPRPVFVIGCGAIVREAHLPAYAMDGVQVGGFFDIEPTRALALASATRGATAHPTLGALVAACSAADGVYDLALPPQALREAIDAIPEGATALLQKPFGRDLDEATALLAAIERRGIRGCVNLQLRHAPVITHCGGCSRPARSATRSISSCASSATCRGRTGRSSRRSRAWRSSCTSRWPHSSPKHSYVASQT